MESLVRSIFALAGRGLDAADTIWIKIADMFFTIFVVVMVCVPIFAHFHLQTLIFITMLVFFMVWIVASLRLRYVITTGSAAFVYGIPAEGDASGYVQNVLGYLLKAIFLVLIWSEVWMAVYFHFPAIAREWWMIGSAIAVMLVVIPLVIYALATGMMKEGPWHRWVLIPAVILLMAVMFSAIPNSTWTSLGFNPLTFSIPETTDRAQEIRAKSYQNLVDQKLKEMHALEDKVSKGQVLNAEELDRLQTLEREAKAVPAVPKHHVVEVIEAHMPESIDAVSNKQIVIAVVVLLALYWLFKKAKGNGPLWLALGIVLVYVFFPTQYFEPKPKEVVQSETVRPQTAVRFIMQDDWDKIAARKIADDPVLQNMEPVLKIERGQYNGQRPVPLLGMNGGSAITLLIVPNEDDETKDIIISQQLQCPVDMTDGMWMCTTTWRARGNPNANGSALLQISGGRRTITLMDSSGAPKAQFLVFRK